MAETAGTDLGVGGSLLFVLLGVLAAVGTGLTAYLASANHSDQMQLFSGLTLAVSLLAGGIAIVLIHVYE
jgi:hypothetical protein